MFGLRFVLPTASFPQHPLWYPRACEIQNNLLLSNMQQNSTAVFPLMPKDSMIDYDCWNTSQTCTQSLLCSQNSLLCEIRAGGLRISWFIVSVEVLSIRPQRLFILAGLDNLFPLRNFSDNSLYLITMWTTLWCPNEPMEVSYILNTYLLDHNSWTEKEKEREREQERENISISFFHSFSHASFHRQIL